MLYRAVRRFSFLKAMLGRETFHRVEKNTATEFHGSGYGGWAIAKQSLDEKSIVYSIGIGEDASFDQSLMERYQLKIHAYDPTPKSIAWVQSELPYPRFIFHPIAIGDKNGYLNFYEPNPNSTDQVSASIYPVNVTSKSYEVPCQTLETMLAANGHSCCDVLKMDIEGAEYSVLEQLCQSGVIGKVKQLLVEFHHFFPAIGIQKTNAIVEKLRNCGFQIAWISRTNHEYLFLRSDLKAYV